MKQLKILLKSDRFVFWGLILISSLVCIFIYKEISRPQLTAWDESGFIWWAYIIRTAFISNWIDGFWEASKIQVLYPFLQSWYLAFMSLFLGFNINSMRLASVLLFIPAVILMWLLSKTLMPQKRVMHVLPVFIFMTSPMMIYYFSTAMKEGLGAVLTLFCFYLYFKAKEKLSYFLYFLTSLSLLILFLTKYNYAILVFVPLIIDRLWDFFVNKKQVYSWRFFGWLVIPFTFGFVWWVFLTHNIVNVLWNVLQNNSQENPIDQINILSLLLYYPLEIVYSYLLHPLMIIFVIVGLFWSLKHWSLYMVRVLMLFFFLNFLLGIYHMNNNQARFIFTSIPALFLITGVGLNFLIEDLNKNLILVNFSKKKNSKTITIVSVLVGIFFIGSQLLNFPTRVRSTGSHQVGSAIFYESDYQQNTRFNFNLSDWPQKLPIATKLSGQTIDDVFKYVFSQTNPTGNFVLIGRLNEISPGLFDLKIALERKKRWVYFLNKSKVYFVVVQIEPGSRFANTDYKLHYPKDLVEKVLQDKSLSLVSKKTFPYLGLTITILSGINVDLSKFQDYY